MSAILRLFCLAQSMWFDATDCCCVSSLTAGVGSGVGPLGEWLLVRRQSNEEVVLRETSECDRSHRPARHAMQTDDTELFFLRIIQLMGMASDWRWE